MPQVIWMNKKYGKEWEKSTKPLLSTKNIFLIVETLTVKIPYTC